LAHRQPNLGDGSIRQNLILNFLGQGWVAIISIALIPFYIKYLGAEAYGVVGLFALMQAWFQLLDVGLSSTLSREMGRFKGGGHTPHKLRELLRTVEVLALSGFVLSTTTLYASAPWITENWIADTAIDVKTVEMSITIMGFYAGFRLFEGCFKSALVGLQLHYMLNVSMIVSHTLRGLGSLFLMAQVSNSIVLFFVWNACVSAATALVYCVMVYLNTPQTNGRVALFSVEALTEVRGFSLGIVGITFVSLLLTHSDRLVLSRVLSLAEFGYYSFAASAAGALYLMVTPISQTYYPKLCELRASGNLQREAHLFHQAAQMVTVFMGAVAVFSAYHIGPILTMWTSNAALVNSISSTFSVLLLGNLCNSIMIMPYQLQLSSGLTSLTFKINLAMVCVVVPTLLIVAPKYGSLGAATVWLLLNCLYLVVGAELMFRAILASEKRRWYLLDVIFPLAAVSSTIQLFAHILPLSKSESSAELLAKSIVTVTAAILSGAFAASKLRSQLIRAARAIKAKVVG